MWTAAQLPGADLEKRFTEFQVVVSPAGQPLGALGLHISGQHGRLHGEAFQSAERADEFRRLLWGRLQNVARNNGLARLWTQEKAPFWPQNGFAAAPPEVLQKLPAVFAGAAADWLTLKLKEELAGPSLDQELALFQQSQQMNAQRILRQTRILKAVAAAVSFLVLILVLIAGYLFWKKRPPGSLESPPGVTTNEPAAK